MGDHAQPARSRRLDRKFRQLRSAEAPWLAQVQAVVNQLGDDSLAGVPEFLEREYDLPVVGTVPHEPGFWRGVEVSHSLQPFSSEIRDEGHFASWFGHPALRVRRAIEGVAARLEESGVDRGPTGTAA